MNNRIETTRRLFLAAGSVAIGSASLTPAAAVEGVAVAAAIQRHRAAVDALDAWPSDEDFPKSLTDEENSALEALALTPCADDAQFIEKMRYLLAIQKAAFGEFWLDLSHETLLAVDLHVNGEA